MRRTHPEFFFFISLYFPKKHLNALKLTCWELLSQDYGWCNQPQHLSLWQMSYLPPPHHHEVVWYWLELEQNSPWKWNEGGLGRREERKYKNGRKGRWRWEEEEQKSWDSGCPLSHKQSITMLSSRKSSLSRFQFVHFRHFVQDHTKWPSLLTAYSSLCSLLTFVLPTTYFQ